MVGYGIEGDIIHYMNPDPNPDHGGYRYLPYDSLVNNGTWEWKHSLTTSFPRGGFCCCNNGVWDAHKGELGVDCGGPCPNNCGTPPLDHCSNRIRDADEEGIDCGGKLCPPCTPCNNCTLDPGEDAGYDFERWNGVNAKDDGATVNLRKFVL